MAYNNNASAMIHDFIIKKIQRKEWEENGRIWTESKICQHLQVSRIAVREVISSLSSMGVLSRKQGSGTYVCEAQKRTLLGHQLFQITPQDIISLMELRIILDSNSAALFVQNATDEDVNTLEKSYYDMLNNRKSIDLFNYYANEFHTLIAKGTKNPFIEKIAVFLDSYLQNQQEVLELATGTDIGIKYHYKILSSLKERNAELAAAYMKYHIELTIEQFKEYLSLGARVKSR